MRGEKVADRFAKSRGAEAIIFVAVNVFALLNAFDDGGVGRWSADAVLL